jgi:hypothetical protein
MNDASMEQQQGLGALLPGIRQHAELDRRTLAYHVQQSDATAADGYWHAAINEARSFLEALVLSIAASAHTTASHVKSKRKRARRDGPSRDGSRNGVHDQAAAALDAYRKGRENHSTFRLSCKYLGELGFLDAEEQTLLQRVYAVASAKGSHHGPADQPWCTLTRQLVRATAHYVLDRYAAWRAPRRLSLAGADSADDARRVRSLGRWIARAFAREGSAHSGSRMMQSTPK